MLLPGFKGLPIKEFVKRLHREIVNDSVTDSAAQLSYYFLFSLFPFLFFLVTLAAYLPLSNAVNDLIDRASYLMPHEALELIQGQLESLVNETQPKLLTAGFFIALWSASRGVDALRRALNLAYDVTESRPYWRTQLVSISMTVAGGMLVVVAFAALIAGGRLGFLAAERLGVEAQFVVIWSWLRWPLTALVVMFAVALAYYLLPDVKQQFKFITPGSVLGTVSWLLATWGFTWYTDSFGRYNVTYGSIAGVVILLLWLYISGLIFIVGGEVNAIIEHASPDGKNKGARVVGEPAATPEERLVAKAPAAAKRASTGRRMLQRMRFWRRRGRRATPTE